MLPEAAGYARLTSHREAFDLALALCVTSTDFHEQGRNAKYRGIRKPKLSRRTVWRPSVLGDEKP